jgi:CheY-like chemotaxis protein
MSSSGGADARGRILVVEDDPEAALFVVYVLANRGGFEVTHTADPAEALRLAAGGHWDLLLTDLDMPGRPGWNCSARCGRWLPRCRSWW